jgi:DUF1680 family protein
LPAGVKISDVMIPSNINLMTRYDQRLLSGVVILEGSVIARQNENWSGQLYREFTSATNKNVSVRFIPYFVWANRGPSEMSVWLPLERNNRPL